MTDLDTVADSERYGRTHLQGSVLEKVLRC
jgi:hypothetical protein